VIMLAPTGFSLEFYLGKAERDLSLILENPLLAEGVAKNTAIHFQDRRSMISVKNALRGAFQHGL
jgi:hypothetical protein